MTDTKAKHTQGPRLRLTKPLLDAIEAGLNAAIAGEGFDGGDFDQMDPEHFERALAWVHQEQERRAAKAEI
jgi:hypothetical protein